MSFVPPPDIPEPRVRGRQVLYLDFDGVLHHEDVCVDRKLGLYFGKVAQSYGKDDSHSHRLFEHAPLLESLLDPYPNVRIVLSTSWVLWRGYEHARARLPVSLAQRCIGATFHKRMLRDQFLDMPRGLQIWSDVTRRNPEAWLAIDDTDEDWPAWCREKLVHSDAHWGIREPGVLANLKEALARTFDQGKHPK